MLLFEAGGSHTLHLLEGGAEIAWVIETDFIGNLIDAEVSVCQQMNGSLYAETVDVVVDSESGQSLYLII